MRTKAGPIRPNAAGWESGGGVSARNATDVDHHEADFVCDTAGGERDEVGSVGRAAGGKPAEADLVGRAAGGEPAEACFVGRAAGREAAEATVSPADCRLNAPQRRLIQFGPCLTTLLNSRMEFQTRRIGQEHCRIGSRPCLTVL